MIDHGTGTILHPQKVKKERLPLAELLNNLPKYPPQQQQQQQQVAPERPGGRSGRSKSRPHTAYGEDAAYGWERWETAMFTVQDSHNVLITQFGNLRPAKLRQEQLQLPPEPDLQGLRRPAAAAGGAAGGDIAGSLRQVGPRREGGG